MSRNRWLLLGLVCLLVAGWFAFGLNEQFTLDALKARQQSLNEFVGANHALSIAAYFGIYVMIAALSIPGAVILTLLGGALFGVVTGTIVVSFASTAGATLAFLVARYLFRAAAERRFANTIERINNGMAKDGPYYLFTLRLVPVFPFFVINIAMALTRLRAHTFAWVSQLGMLPGTIVYVNAGTQFARIDSAGDILSPGLIGSFALLGIFPLAARKTLDYWQARRMRRAWPRPSTFDANLVVIGAGSAGLVTAYVAAAAKARVVLIERERMGGDCLNTGCVPSKALIRSARIASYIARAEEFGIRVDGVSVDFPKVMQRVRDVIARIEPHDSVERYTALGVDCIIGEATIESPWSVRVGGRVITTRAIVIATGGSPTLPPIPGIDDVRPYTSDTIWSLEALPRHLLVLGGGPIGCELAQAFRYLGAEVTLVEREPRLLLREDPEVSAALVDRFDALGIRVLTGYTADRFHADAGRRWLTCSPSADRDGAAVDIPFDAVLVATGRRAQTGGLGLQQLGIRLGEDGTIAVNEYLQTRQPNILACGDVAGPYQLTHAAGYQGWYCAMNALFGRWWRLRVDYSAMPWAVFTDPEVARVGITEAEARERKTAIDVTRYGIDDLDRAIADGEARGFVKIITAKNSDRILGVTIVGPHAAELIAEFVSAMRNKLGLRKTLGTIHIYPTLAEANKQAAGAWQQARLSPRMLALAAKFNTWMRS